MKEILIKKHIRYLFGIVFLLFLLNKIFIRPWILENEPAPFFEVISYSIPNLIEAIMGTIILTGILYQMRQYFNNKLGAINDLLVNILAVGVVSIYVFSQELKFHNLGGNNVYDLILIMI